MLAFYTLFLFLLLQRGGELYLAKRNERWMLSKGAFEVGSDHYKYFVILHTLFLFSLFTEVHMKNYQITWWSLVFFLLFILAQGIRLWSIFSLGKFWNTKIIVLPRAKLIKRGPYKFLRHPNYLVVAIEILVIPLMFQAFLTAGIFTCLNAYLLLFIRIPLEERALEEATMLERKDLFKQKLKYF